LRSLTSIGEPSERFLRLARVGLDPSDRFGAGGVDGVRLNFATSAAILDQATATMAQALCG
jgi:cystathionine beta-lyase